MQTDQSFLPLHGNYRNLVVYQKTECIYDITYYFAHHFLEKGDRTIDQMIQAARSGKQNIAEGCSAGTTSRETEIKLLNVARASLDELVIDYEDYLRTRDLQQWPVDSVKGIQARRACIQHNDSKYYRDAIKVRTDETIANIAITLIHQAHTMLLKLIETNKKEFLEQGGIKEEKYRARLKYRSNQNPNDVNNKQ